MKSEKTKTDTSRIVRAWGFFHTLIYGKGLINIASRAPTAVGEGYSWVYPGKYYSILYTLYQGWYF